MTGSWEVNINVSGMPQKIATAMGKLNETHLGAEYEFVAYLGSQVVNGTNHAVLAEQTIVNGRDSKNAVILVFNEKPNIIDVSLVRIDTIVESGGELGGTDVNIVTDIPEDAMEVWNNAFTGFVGAKYSPVALLGTQMVNGTNYIFLAECTGLRPDDKAELLLVTVNTDGKKVFMGDALSSRQEALVGYAFTWLKRN